MCNGWDRGTAKVGKDAIGFTAGMESANIFSCVSFSPSRVRVYDIACSFLFHLILLALQRKSLFIWPHNVYTAILVDPLCQDYDFTNHDNHTNNFKMYVCVQNNVAKLLGRFEKFFLQMVGMVQDSVRKKNHFFFHFFFFFLNVFFFEK